LLPILARVADAVTAAHDRLTPHTVLLTDNGEVTLAWSGSPEETGAKLQQPKYSAPDLFRDVASSPEAVDVYLLGFIFYEFLAGARNFTGQIGAEWEPEDPAWFRWHADTALRLRPLADVVPEFPASVSRLVEGMLEKDSARRAPLA